MNGNFSSPCFLLSISVGTQFIPELCLNFGMNFKKYPTLGIFPIKIFYQINYILS